MSTKTKISPRPSTNRHKLAIVAVTCLIHCHVTLPTAAAAATILVATSDSSEQMRKRADFVGDGHGDQEEINAAIAALPPVGGTIHLAEGRYDIRRVDGTLGGITIDRSYVTLVGEGPATQLVLASNQNTNVIRIIGDGVGHITIRELAIDANRTENSTGGGDPGISHDRFEYCGIKAFRHPPRGPYVDSNTHDITIRHCIVRNAHRLNIMLEGPNMRVLDNTLGNAGSDSVEILTGPGIIRGNYVEITGRTHVAIGSDRGNSIVMAGNIVDVRAGGDLDIAFRSWAESERHVISGNVLTVHDEGRCGLAVDSRGSATAIVGNTFQGPAADPLVRLKLSATSTTVIGNVFQHVHVDGSYVDGTDASSVDAFNSFVPAHGANRETRE